MHERRRVRGVDPPRADGAHEMEPSARRLGLEMRDAVGRTRLEAESAVDASFEASQIEGGCHEGSRPGASTPRGSNRVLSSRAIAFGIPEAPHAPPTARL